MFYKDLSDSIMGRHRPEGRGVFFLFLLGFLMVACTEESTTPVASPPLMETGADAVLTGLTHNITVEGVRQAHLVADTAFSFADSASYRLVTPNLILYSETGVEEARVTSERGRYNPSTKEMLATGNVILVINEGNRRVESQELNYSPYGDRIWSDSFTVMRESGRVLEGMGFESDLGFENATVGPGSIRNTGEVTPVEAGTDSTDTLSGAMAPADTLPGEPDTLRALPDTVRTLPDTLAPAAEVRDLKDGTGRRPVELGESAD